ncbi:hypothetical protein D3C80_1094920 [compost metagenome]
MALELAAAIVLEPEKLTIIRQQHQLVGMVSLPTQHRLVDCYRTAGIGEVDIKWIILAQGIVGCALGCCGGMRTNRHEVRNLRNDAVISSA